MSQAIRLVATLDLKSGSWDQISAVVRECVKQSQKEDGNGFYMAHFEQGNSNRVVFIEEWADEEAIDTHCKTAHFQNLIKTVEPFLERPMQLLTLTEV